MIKIFAHSGSKLLWPENTMLAFDHAHDAGATGFETDLRLSQDGVIILSHDDNLSRFGHPDKTISTLSLSDIQKIQIQSKDGRYRDAIIPLQTLLEKYPDKDYIFDCKISDLHLFEKLKKLLQDLNFHRSLYFLTWSKAADGYVGEFFPDCGVFPSVNRSTIWGVLSLFHLGRLWQPENAILSLPARSLGLKVFKKNQIKSIIDSGKDFVGYLINSESDFYWCRQCNIRIFLTDRPDLINTLIGNEVKRAGPKD